MKFLLVNTNAAVKKIFSIAARKAAIHLDSVNSIAEIPLKEDYNCIFIDDGVLNTGNFQNFKNKMITTKFCLILMKDKPAVGGFDTYIHKPFLPTDIYDVLKKEKYDDMSFSSYENKESDNQANYNTQDVLSDKTNNSTIDLDLDLLDISNENTKNMQNINNIDLSEFSDNEDEFLSGTKDAQPIVDELKIAPQTLDTKSKIENKTIDDDLATNNIKLNGRTMNDDEVNFTYSDEPYEFTFNDDTVNSDADNTTGLYTRGEFDSIPLENDALDLLDIGIVETPKIHESPMIQEPPIIQESPKIVETVKPKNIEPSIQKTQRQVNTNTTTNQKAQYSNEVKNRNSQSNDEIDFSSIFALQDEFLQSQNKEKKTLIGGDVYTRKEPSSNPTNSQSTNSQPQHQTLKPQNTPNPIQQEIQQVQIEEKEDYSDFENMSFDFPDDSFESKVVNKSNTLDDENVFDSNNQDSFIQNTNQYNIKNINDLSDEELDSLDDETLLKLQEESLNNINTSNQDSYKEINEPQILNKKDIDELSDILEDTNSLKIKNNELDSITQEALSEVLDETKMDDTSFDFYNLDEEIKEDTQIPDIQIPATKIQNQVDDNPNIAQASPTNTNINIGDSKSNVNVDLSEIIKSLPIDKLRELLSGVQITINITFPNKK